MQPVNFFDLHLLDQCHYMGGMGLFITKYASLFFLKLVHRTGWMILNTGYRILARGFGFLFSGNDNNQNHEDEVGEEWDFGDVEQQQQPNAFQQNHPVRR
jgi:hypothetical protein